MLLVGAHDDASDEVVIDLLGEVALDGGVELFRLLRRDAPVGHAIFFEEKFMGRKHVGKGFHIRAAVHALARREAHGEAEGVIGGDESHAVHGARGQAGMGEDKAVLLRDADAGLEIFFGMIEEADKVVGLLPLPSGVIGLHEPGLLDFGGDFIEIGKYIARRRKAVFHFTAHREAQTAHTSGDFEPRKKKPERDGEPTPGVAAGGEIAAEISGHHHGDPSRLGEPAVVKRAARHRENDEAEDEQDLRHEPWGGKR